MSSKFLIFTRESHQADTFSQVSKVIIFGATGALGSACVHEFADHKWDAVAVGRDLSDLASIGNLDAAVWAQGANFTGSISQTPDQIWEDLWQANVHHIVKSLQILLDSDAFVSGARLVLISSVWQEIARANKLAYIATKSAVGGLVRGLAAELGARHISVNGVLPGIVDTPMTHANLLPRQIEVILKDTPVQELVTSRDVARVVRFLASDESNGINGQSITVDNGWAHSRNV